MNPYQRHAGFNQFAPHSPQFRPTRRQRLREYQKLMKRDMRMRPNLNAYGRDQFDGYQNEAYAPRNAFFEPYQPSHQAYNDINAQNMFIESNEDKIHKGSRYFYNSDHSNVGHGWGAVRSSAESDDVRNHLSGHNYFRRVKPLRDEAIVRYQVSTTDDSETQSFNSRLPAETHWTGQYGQMQFQETAEEWAARIIAARKTYEAARSFEDDHEFLAGTFGGEVGYRQYYSL